MTGPDRPQSPPDGLLVFAAKQVGLELTSFLIEAGCRPAQVYVATAGDQALLELCNSRGIAAQVFDDQTLPRLVRDRRQFDWILNLWSPHILTPDVLALARHRLNTHPGLVPECRGNDCAAWAIRKGVSAGVSLIEMTDEIDTGHVFARQEIDYSFGMTGRQIQDRLEQTLIDLFREKWPDIQAGRILPVAQSAGGSYHTRRQTDQDRVKTGQETGTFQAFATWALAHDFTPGTTAEMVVDDRRYAVRLQIEEIE